MCGIFGAVGPRADSMDATAALARIAHRGPDGEGIWRSTGVVLGHRRLAVIDLTPAGAQPMVHLATGCVLTFNGEIYNHRALRRTLEQLGHRFHSNSDSEVLLAGYVAWGEAVVERLEGMFAFGIWDPRDRSLFMARDRAGEKPLFYSTAADTFVFASEIKAIIAAGVVAEMNVHALPMLLTYGYVPEAPTMYSGVLRLEPGQTMTLRDGATHIRTYYRAPFTNAPSKHPRTELRSTLRELVERAIELRLESDVPLGAFLSGGVDSSILVGVMSRVLGRRVKTFSIGFKGDARFDETHYARLAATTFGTEHHEFALEPASFDLVEALVDAHDGPFGDSSAIPTSVVSMLARRHVTVALSGEGGDELFCGYSRFLAAEAFERVPPSIRRAIARAGRSSRVRAGDARLVTRAIRFLSTASSPLAERLVRWNAVFARHLDQIVHPDLASELDFDAPIRWTERVLHDTPDADPLSRILDHNFRSYLPYDLLVKSDRCSMLHSLEVRAPFLDSTLIDFAASMPNDTRRRGTKTKILLKEAFSDLLPREILTRGKMGFGMPLGTWFRGPLRAYVSDQLAPGARIYSLLDEREVRSDLDEHLSGAADHGHRLWLLLTLEVWMKSLRDGKSYPR